MQSRGWDDMLNSPVCWKIKIEIKVLGWPMCRKPDGLCACFFFLPSVSCVLWSSQRLFFAWSQSPPHTGLQRDLSCRARPPPPACRGQKHSRSGLRHPPSTEIPPQTQTRYAAFCQVHLEHSTPKEQTNLFCTPCVDSFTTQMEPELKSLPVWSLKGQDFCPATSIRHTWKISCCYFFWFYKTCLSFLSVIMYLEAQAW